MDGSQGVGPVRDIPTGLRCGWFLVASPWGAALGVRASCATSGG